MYYKNVITQFFAHLAYDVTAETSREKWFMITSCIFYVIYRYYSGEKEAPVLTIFIGGNHEASNFLQELPYGGWVAKNIYYMGTESLLYCFFLTLYFFNLLIQNCFLQYT